MNVQALAWDALARSFLLRIWYLKPGETEITERDIEVYTFDDIYLDAYCRLRKQQRTFRMDRIERAELLPIPFTPQEQVVRLVSEEGWAGKSDEWRNARTEQLRQD